MKKRTPHFFTTALFAVLIIMLVGCSSQVETKTEDKNIQTIDAVLQSNFSGPDEEAKQILKGEENLQSLSQYQENLYRDYFADDASFRKYVSVYGSVIWIEPIRKGYTLTVKNIEYEKTDSEEIIYDFSVEFLYQKEGSESSEVETVSGQANMNEEHKIENMLIRMKDLETSLSD